MNKKLMLIAKACLLLLLASLGSAHAAAAAGAGAGAQCVRGVARPGLLKAQNEPLSFKAGKKPLSIVYSPDGKWIAVANSESNDITVFRVDSATSMLEQISGSPFKAGTEPYSLAYSPHGDYLVVANLLSDDLTIFKVDKATGRLQQINGSPLAICPDYPQSTIYSFDPDRRSHTPHVVRCRPSSVEYSSDGRWVVVSTEGYRDNLMVFEANKDTGELRQIMESPYSSGQFSGSAVYSSDGKWVAIPDPNGYTLAVFGVNKATGALAQIKGSPFKSGKNFTQPIYSPNGNWLAGIVGGLERGVMVFRVNKDTGALMQIEGSPFAAGKIATSIAYSPEGKWLAVSNYYDNTITIFKVDKDTGALQPIKGSPFLTRKEPRRIAYSPDGGCLAVVSDDGMVSIYEIDQESGALSPITGDVLKIVRQRYQEAGRVLTNTEKMANKVMAQGVMNIIQEYALGPNPRQQKDASVLPDTQTEALKAAIDRAEEQRKKGPEQVSKLFVAIKEGNAGEVDALLTPFTINARDDEYNTPLIAAASYQHAAVVQKILEYVGAIQRDAYHKDIVRARLNATNRAKNSALKLALTHANYQIARMIVQEMHDRHIKDNKELYLNPVELIEILDQLPNKDDKDIKKIIELLQSGKKT